MAIYTSDPNYSFKFDPYDENDINYNKIASTKILLEPRLQEYMKKKKYYKINNIIGGVNLEKDYQITNEDKKIMIKFLKGKTIYDDNNVANKLPTHTKKPMFPSSNFKPDPRVKIPVKDDKMPLNMGMFYDDDASKIYQVRSTVPLRDNREMTRSSSTLQRPSHNIDGMTRTTFQRPSHNINELTRPNSTLQGNTHMTRPNPTSHNDRYIPKHLRKNNPENKKDIYSIDGSMHPSRDFIKDNTNDTSNYLDCIGSKILGDEFKSTLYSKNKRREHHDYYRRGESSMELDTGRVIPYIEDKKNSSSNWDRIMTHPHKQNNMPSIDCENELLHIPQHTPKSYGYRNPSNHYFQFLDKDHIMPSDDSAYNMRAGENSRSSNKSSRKDIKRNIY